MPADGAGATGDQRTATRRPVPLAGAGFGGVAHPAAEYSGGPDSHLVLAAAAQHRGQPCGRPLFQHLGQVHQPAPAVRVFHADDAAQAPDLRLHRAGRHLAGDGRHGTAGDRPQRCLDVGVTEGLYESQGGGQSGGHR